MDAVSEGKTINAFSCELEDWFHILDSDKQILPRFIFFFYQVNNYFGIRLGSECMPPALELPL